MADIAELVNTSATESMEAPETQGASENGSESRSEEKVDWETRALEAEKARESLQHNFDSLRGQTLKDTELRATIAATQDGQSALNKKVNLLVEALGSQTDGLADKAQAIDGESAQAQTVRALIETSDRYRTEIADALKESGLDGDDTGVQEVHGLWNEVLAAAKDGTSSFRVLTLMSDAQHKADLLARSALRAREVSAKKATKAERKRVEEETGAFDMDTGPGSGGANDPMEGMSAAEMMKYAVKQKAERGEDI
jgi:hypothetical protein